MVGSGRKAENGGIGSGRQAGKSRRVGIGSREEENSRRCVHTYMYTGRQAKVYR